MLTTALNTAWATVHHQMPAVLAPDDVARWLDPALALADAQALCAPCGDAGLRFAPVAAAVAA